MGRIAVPLCMHIIICETRRTYFRKAFHSERGEEMDYNQITERDFNNWDKYIVFNSQTIAMPGSHFFAHSLNSTTPSLFLIIIK